MHFRPNLQLLIETLENHMWNVQLTIGYLLFMKPILQLIEIPTLLSLKIEGTHDTL